MTEPILFSLPISLLFLYFIIYSFLGWAMETTYCSIGARHFVARGFLYGPICPIYGVGVVMMICWFAPLTGNPFLFYVVSTVVMSAWEYFVGWFLEATTHIKYWDYSNFRFNLHGRICLWVCLVWGALSYVVIFWVHPFISTLVLAIPLTARYIAAGVLSVLLTVDIVLTIRQLALITKLMAGLDEVNRELRRQLSQSREELSDRLDSLQDAFAEKLDTAKDSLTDRMDALFSSLPEETREQAYALQRRYRELLEKAERQSRRLRHAYRDMSSRTWGRTLESVKHRGQALRERVRRAAGKRADDE